MRHDLCRSAWLSLAREVVLGGSGLRQALSGYAFTDRVQVSLIMLPTDDEAVADLALEGTFYRGEHTAVFAGMAGSLARLERTALVHYGFASQYCASTACWASLHLGAAAFHELEDAEIVPIGSLGMRGQVHDGVALIMEMDASPVAEDDEPWKRPFVFGYGVRMTETWGSIDLAIFRTNAFPDWSLIGWPWIGFTLRGRSGM